MSIASSSEITNSNDSFVLGGPVTTDTGTLITGQNLVKFTALGRIAASGKLTKAVDSAVDGSNAIVGFLVHAIDATSADKACQIYTGGKFNKALAVVDASYTAVELLARLDRTPMSLVTPT